MNSLFGFILTLGTAILYSCSSDTTISDESNSITSTNKLTNSFSEGDEIAEYSEDAWIITADTSKVAAYLEDIASDLNVHVGITPASISIEETLIQGTNDKALILVGSTSDGLTKVGTLLKQANGIHHPIATIYSIDFQAHGTCTSTSCQFGCMPASVLNPSTGKTVLTCSSCTNTCTKTASI